MPNAIPEQLKKDIPETAWGKVLAATPVVMTVIATLLAGLASSEMTRAQYDRAWGAQLQSKAADQWSYFQSKKLRAALHRDTLDLLQALVEIRPPGNPAAEKIPPLPALPLDAQLQAAVQALAKQRPEAELAAALQPVGDASLAAAVQTARDQLRDFDAGLAPARKAVDELTAAAPAGDRSAARDVAAARMRLAAARYDAEATLNQNLANLLELQVRKANVSAERHHQRSGLFFFGMLTGQAAVIVATFALAARRKNMLWTLAALAGAAAVVFAGYVYLRM